MRTFEDAADAVNEALDRLEKRSTRSYQWLHIDEQKPSAGQRCVVWDLEYGAAMFAYWDRDIDGNFYEWVKGDGRIVKTPWWMPEPGPPK